MSPQQGVHPVRAEANFTPARSFSGFLSSCVAAPRVLFDLALSGERFKVSAKSAQAVSGDELSFWQPLLPDRVRGKGFATGGSFPDSASPALVRQDWARLAKVQRSADV